MLPRRKALTWALSEFENHRADTYTADAWAIAVEKQGLQPRSTVTVRRIEASAEIAGWLEISEGDTVIVRDRIRYADDQPYMVNRSYFPTFVAAGTRLEEPGDQSAPGGLLAEVGQPQVRVRDSITAPVASSEETRTLQISQGSRVWSVVRIGYQADGAPVRAMHTIAPIDIWQIEFAQIVAGSDVSSPFLSQDYPADPYPGARPDVSFAEVDGAAWVLRPSAHSPSGWTVDLDGSLEKDLDSWLTARAEDPCENRLPVLAYGSNASPGKIQWIRETLGLSGVAVVLTAYVEGISAVWSAGTRERDGQRPAVLAAKPGSERHAVWLATPQQRAVLDQVEGRGQRYRLAWVHAPVEFDNGARFEWVLAYVARPEVIGQDVAEHLNRSPLLVNGETVRMADMSQDQIRHTAGDSASSDGLDVIEVTGEPSAADRKLRRSRKD